MHWNNFYWFKQALANNSQSRVTNKELEHTKSNALKCACALTYDGNDFWSDKQALANKSQSRVTNSEPLDFEHTDCNALQITYVYPHSIKLKPRKW
jgi:hypothetical protein